MTAQTQTATLFGPFNLGGLTLKNRGRPVVSNGWPLNPVPDPITWYSFNREGYTDFLNYQASY